MGCRLATSRQHRTGRDWRPSQSGESPPNRPFVLKSGLQPHGRTVAKTSVVGSVPRSATRIRRPTPLGWAFCFQRSFAVISASRKARGYRAFCVSQGSHDLNEERSVLHHSARCSLQIPANPFAVACTQLGSACGTAASAIRRQFVAIAAYSSKPPGAAKDKTLAFP